MASEAMDALLQGDEVREVLRETFYDGPKKVEPKAKPKRAKAKKPKPDHYRVICISMYEDDLGRLDAAVAELKASGHRKMSRSALIRFALDQMNVEDLPKSY